MLKKVLMTFFAVGCAVLLNAAPVVRQDGSFDFENVHGLLAWFGSDWSMTGFQPDTVVWQAGFPQRTPSSFTAEGTLKLFGKDGRIRVKENIRTTSTSLKLQAQMTGTAGKEPKLVCLMLQLPVKDFAGTTLMADGVPVTLKKEFSKEEYPFFPKSTTVILPLKGDRALRISGRDFEFRMQDERIYGGNTFTFRLFAAKRPGAIPTYDCNFALSIIKMRPKKALAGGPVDIHPLDLRSIVNMAWRDEVADDRKGGWTDQGDNDLRDMEPGRFIYRDVPVEFIDPVQNNGKSCLVFAGPDRGYLLNKAELRNVNRKGERLYLIHGIAWAPSQKVKTAALRVRYQDGSVDELPIIANVDVGNWWHRGSLANGLPVWRGANNHSWTTLYLSKFELDPDKTVDAITFLPEKNSVWMVAAVSLGSAVPALEMPGRCVLKADQNWKVIDCDLNVAKHSPLDFSSNLDAPAGKYGFVKAVGDHFEFEKRPGVPVRFYGTNLCWSSLFLNHRQADEIADRLARLGFNSVRLHHHDMMLTEVSKTPEVLDPARLEALDYLIYACKKRGIYVTTDCFTWRDLNFGNVPDFRPRTAQDAKQGFAVSAAARMDVKLYAKSLLGHVNPYTKLALKDDPVLLSLCIVNENEIDDSWRSNSRLAALFENAFKKWCAQKKLAYPADGTRSQLFLKFKVAAMEAEYLDFKKYLKEELGVKVPLTDNNMSQWMWQTAQRSLLDYSDTHAYWEHPNWLQTPWQLPHFYPQESCVRNCGGNIIDGLACRVWNKPHMITELDFCYPNHYRGEGALVTGAYASFQRASGIYRFAYSHYWLAMFHPMRPDMFDTVRDPVNLFADRIASLMFLRGDVTPAKTMLPYAYTKDDTAANVTHPTQLRHLALMTGTGVIDATHGPLSSDAPRVVLANQNSRVPGARVTVNKNDFFWQNVEKAVAVKRPADGVFRNETGEITLRRHEGILQVVTPRTEGLVVPAGKAVAGKLLQVKNGSTFFTCVLTTKKGAPLAEAPKMLFFALTDVMASGVTFADSENTTLESHGHLPLLLRRGTIEVAVKAGNERNLEVHLLDMAGRRVARVPVKKENGAWRFTFDNDLKGSKKPVFCAEVVRVK